MATSNIRNSISRPVPLSLVIRNKLSTPNRKLTEEEIKPIGSQPHDALFFVLAYLNFLDLLKCSRVCKSFKDAVDNDVLLWFDFIVEPPLNLKITDDVLLKFTDKAQGRLRSLGITNCVRITDGGLQRVIEKNPNITKLYIQSCTQMTPDGILKVVESSNKLEMIRVENIYSLKKNHLQTLYSSLNIKPQDQKPNIYLEANSNPVDIEICPKCSDVRLVFQCLREKCKSKNERPLSACKGCLFCVPRCEGCGGCVDQEETGETACADVVCLDCWLKLPKCNLCNKPYCNRHLESIELSNPNSSGFVCEGCLGEMEQWLSSPH
ncbi:hypothetical protein ACHQM5_019213 [Ranunculus cassubicifolius]